MFNFVLRPAAAAVLALGMTSSGVFAQAVSADGVTVLDEVIVSATRYEQQLSDVLPSASVITREEIESSQAPTLIDLIQSEPGVEIGRNGGPGTVSSIFMRGQESKNVAVFIDGVPVQRDSYGGLKLVDIPPSQIEKIEILRGNMGSIYGEAAVGGAIHIFTRSGTGTSGPTASASYGSRNTSDLTAGYNLNGDDYKLGFSVQRYATDGYSAMNPSQNSLVNPEDDAFERESIFMNGERTINDQVAIGFQANQIKADVDYDRNSAFSGDDSDDTHNSRQKSSDLTAYSRINLSPDWSSRIAITQSNFENREFKNSTAGSYYEGDQLGVQWSNIYKVGTGNANFGIDITDAEFETPTKYERDSLGYYLGYSGRLDRLDYQANLRRDEVKDKTAFIEKTANTWLLGLGYLVTDRTKLTGLVSSSFRFPSSAEFGDTPLLKPEDHKGYEFGVSYSTRIGTLKANYFKSNTTNAISYSGLAAPAAVVIGSYCGSNCYENIGKVENKGYELSLIGNTAGWGYKFSAVVQDPRNAENGDRLTRRAKQYGSIEVNKEIFGVEVDTQVKVSRNSADFDYDTWPYTPKELSYTVVNLSAIKKLTPEWTAKLRLENAFDEKYQLAYGYDAVPRGIFVSLQYQPK